MSFPGGTIPSGIRSLWAGGGDGTGTISPILVGPGILYPALRKAGITLGPQRTPSPAQYQDAIDELNRLMGSLSCDRFFIYTMSNYSFPLTAGKNAYTIGIPLDPSVSPDFAAPRPVVIESANVVMNGGTNTRYPLALVTDLQWARIAMPNLATGISGVLYNNRAYPLSTLHLAGVPGGDSALELFVWYTIPKVMTPDDVIAVPEGYEDALVLNLAVRLAPHFQRVLDQNVREDARIALMHVRSINAPQPILEMPAGWGCGCGDGGSLVISGGSGGTVPATAPPAPTVPEGSAGSTLSYAGIVERDGSMHGPPGWTITHPSTGVYTVTHNLNLNPTTYAVVATFARGTEEPIDPGKASGIVVHVRDQEPNFFTVVMGEGKDLTSFIDAGFNFTLS